MRLFPSYAMKPCVLVMRWRLPAAWNGTLVMGRSCSEATTHNKNLADKSYLLRKGERQLHAKHLPHCVSHSLWYCLHQQRHQSANTAFTVESNTARPILPLFHPRAWSMHACAVQLEIYSSTSRSTSRYYSCLSCSIRIARRYGRIVCVLYQI